jgi:NADPH:quinone reductase-like Zn-dependent oxidoreductase
MARAPFDRRLPAPSFSMPDKREAIAVLHDLLAAGKLTPVVDSTYPLAEVREAIRRLESGGALGRVVLTV